MTSPTVLTAAPVVAAGSGRATPSAAGPAERSPGFTSALDDALTGGTDPGRPQTGRAGDDAPAADEPDADDATPAPAVLLQPGLWALLSAVQPLSAPVPGPTAATGSADAAAASVGVVGAVLATGGSTPSAAAAPVATPIPTGAAVATAAAPGTPATTAPAPAPPPTPEPAETPTPAVVPRPAVAAAPAAPAAPATAVPASAPAVDAGTAVPAVTDVLPVTASGTTSDTAGSNSDGAGDGPAAPTPAPGADDRMVALPTTPAVTAAAPIEATAAPAAGDPPVAAQLSRQLAVLSNAPDGSQTMTLVITPDDLGPVSIQATVTGGNLELTLHGAHEHGRHALVEALPDLRRDLESAGITLDRLEVGADAGGDGSPWTRAQQQLADAPGQGRAGQPATAPSGRARTGDHPGEGSTARTTNPSTSSGVDLLV